MDQLSQICYWFDDLGKSGLKTCLKTRARMEIECAATPVKDRMEKENFCQVILEKHEDQRDDNEKQCLNHCRTLQQKGELAMGSNIPSEMQPTGVQLSVG